MFTDIVGYTSMMGSDEELAIAAVSNHRDILTNKVPKYQGELVQFYGDGCLAIFSSAVFALDCAMDIQQTLKNCSPPVPLRVGLHIGEILVKDQAVFGDGINIASRIESLGQPGTVFFSEEVHLKTSNVTRFKSELIGSFDFKNVAHPMKVYALTNQGFTVPEKETITGKLKTTSTNVIKSNSANSQAVKSIAVLPFETFSSDGELMFITGGIADEIRSQLLSINDLKVISRSSCKKYGDSSYTLNQVRSELDVEYVLEGRVQVFANQIKVSVELSETKTSNQVWSLAPMNQTLDDVFTLQTEIAQQVVRELEILLTDQEQDSLGKAPTKNREAFMHYQQGQELLHRGGGKIEELTQAELCFKSAIELDPDFSRAYLGLSDVYLEHITWGRKPPIDVLDKAKNATLKALELDDTSGEFYGALGAIYFFQMKKTQASRFLNKAIEISPNYLDAHEKLAWITIHDGNTEEALELFETARSLDPLRIKYMGIIGHAYYYAHRFEEGIDHISGYLEKYPDDPWLLWMKGYLYSGLGQYQQAIDTYLQRPTGKDTNWMLAYNYAMNGHTDLAREILEIHLDRRNSQYVPSYMFATIFAGLGHWDEALEWLEKDYQEGGGLFFWVLRTDPKFDELRSQSRFQNLLAKIR